MTNVCGTKVDKQESSICRSVQMKIFCIFNGNTMSNVWMPNVCSAKPTIWKSFYNNTQNDIAPMFVCVWVCVRANKMHNSENLGRC